MGAVQKPSFSTNARSASLETETAIIQKPVSQRFKVFDGNPLPFGATACDGGINFAIFSSNAVSAILCLISLSDLQNVRFYIFLLFLYM